MQVLDTLYRHNPEILFGGGVVLLVIWLVIAIYVIKHFERIVFEIRLHIKKLFEGGMRRNIFTFLRAKGIQLDVVMEDGTKLCAAVVGRIRPETVLLDVVRDYNLSAAQPGCKIICNHRPLWFGVNKYNFFETFYLGKKKLENDKIQLRVKMPLQPDDKPRRGGWRKRIRVQRTLIVRGWFRDPEKSGGGRFIYSQPSFEINVEYNINKLNKERVFDVSRHGIRVGVHLSILGGRMPTIDEDICLEVKPWVHQLKKFDSFLFGGKVRHVVRTHKDMVVMGIEFTLVGRKSMVGDHLEYVWEKAQGSEISQSFLWTIKQLDKGVLRAK